MRAGLMAGGAVVGLFFGGLCGAAFGYAPSESGTRTEMRIGASSFPVSPAPWSRGSKIDPYTLCGGILAGGAIGMAGGWLIAEAAKRDSVKA
jgi:hypothetical protein